MTKLIESPPAYCASFCLQPDPEIQPRWLVDPLTGCWEWQGSRKGRRYAQFSRRGELVHRRHYVAVHGEIPEGMEIDHLCGNTFCVNPWHLEAITHAENVHRGRSGKLTRTERDAIRESTEVSAVLAARFGISAGHVRRVRGALRDKGFMRKGVR